MNATAQEIMPHVEPQAPAVVIPQGDAVLSMIERAARDPNVDIDKFERLMAMKERMAAEQARRDFDEAISAAKGEIGPIAKNRRVDFTSQKGRTHYQHEDFAGIAHIVDPILGKYGLAYRFRSKQDGRKLTVTCILSKGGYFEETTLATEEDHSGNKNGIQAIGSAATYLQRYTLKLALGLASSHDDDGRATAKPQAGSRQAQSYDQGERDPIRTITPAQVSELQQAIVETGANIAGFLKWMNVERLEDIESHNLKTARDALELKRKKQ